MLNPEIWVWLRTAVWGNDIQRPLDANRNELCDQSYSLQEGFRQRMLDFDKSVRSEKHVEVDALIVAVEHSLKQSLLYVPRGLNGLTRGVVVATQRLVANFYLSTFNLTPLQYAKEFEKHIDAIRVYRKLIHQETLGDHMSTEYREMVQAVLHYLKKIEKITRKVAAILFREHKDAVKDYHRKYEEVRLRIGNFSAIESPLHQLTEWAKKNPDAFDRMVYDIRNGSNKC